jgi:hypothetical protein
MPAVPFQVTVPLNATVNVNLAPFDRFGGGGGRVAVRATVPTGLAVNAMLMTVLVGSDVLVNQGPVFAETAAGVGPTSETPVVMGIGTPSDPITITLANTTGAAIVVTGVADVQNA